MSYPADKPEAPTDEQVGKAQKALKKAHNAQPMNAAVGAAIGGVTATTVSVGALLYQTFKEFSKNANRAGVSILEMRNKQMGDNVVKLTAANPKSIAALRPLVWASLLAPFAGSAIGAWVATMRGNKDITKKHDALNNAMENTWQKKIANEHDRSAGKTDHER